MVLVDAYGRVTKVLRPVHVCVCVSGACKIPIYFMQMEILGPVYTKRQHLPCDNSAMVLVILFTSKTMDSLENGLQSHSGVTPFFQ